MEELMMVRSDDWGVMKLQNCILNIAKYIDAFCSENGINYCLMGGSALGAIRHSGFIPWDDDLDIFMSPKDYSRFRSLFNTKGDKDNYYLQEWGESNGMVSLAKLRYNHSSYIEEDLKDKDINQGVFVDIFILHDSPDNKYKRLWQYIWAKYIVAKGGANRNMQKKGLLNVVLSFLKIFPKRFLLNYALKQVYRFDNESSSYKCHFLGRANMKKGLYKREYFIAYKRVPFETIKLSVPLNVEQYLVDRWGDYMKLPSIDEIKHYQHCWQSSVDKTFLGYKENGDYKDEKNLLA